MRISRGKINFFMCCKLLAIVLTFLFKIEFKLAYGCPSDVCMCKWKGGKQTVECGSQFLIDLPEGMAQETQILNFSGNSLQILQNERFLRMDLINLQKIYLSRNQIIKIHEKSFRGLSNLVELDLSDNLLQQIPSETFQDYTSLMRLSLSGNPIRDLKTSSFRYLSFLTTLELSNCHIERIENEAFVGMDNLEWLRLDGNRIGYIQGNHILPKALHGISLQRNDWQCDCRLTDLHAWLVNYNTPQIEEPKCVRPIRLKGQIIKSLKKDELACLPEVQPKSTYTEVFEGRNISIQCTVRAIPEPKVLWLFNGQVLTNDTILENLHMFYYIDENYGEEKRSEVFIYNVGPEDNGTFSCIGQNTAGTTFSNYTLRVMVKELPVVKEIQFPFKDYINYIMVSGASFGGLIVLILCVIVVKCTRNSKNSRNFKQDCNNSNETGLLKCPSIITEEELSPKVSKGTGNNSRSVVSGICISGSNILTSNSNNHAAINGTNKENSMMFVPSTLQKQLHENNGATHLHSSANGQVMAKKDDNHSIELPVQFYSPPSVMRSQQDKNPDLINDAELVQQKIKQNKDYDGNNCSTSSPLILCGEQNIAADKNCDYQLSKQFGSQIIRPTHQQNSHLYNQRKHSTLQRGFQVKSSNQHQVDVHLNPVCFLSQDGYAYDFSNTNLHDIKVEGCAAHQQNQHQNYYRTLPHSRPHNKLYTASPSAATPRLRYSLEAEFLQRNGPPNYEKYVQNMRFTAEGYPVHPAAAIAAIVQYPSPSEGYEAVALSGDNSDICNSVASMPSSGGSFQQWPPYIPGFHVQSTQYSTPPPLVTSTSGIPQYHTLQSSSMQQHHCPMFLQTGSQELASIHIQVPTNTTDTGSCNEVIQKRCISAQTSDLDQSTIAECDEEHEISPQSSKLRHLTGPLADSPDEGYVGDSQEGPDI